MKSESLKLLFDKVWPHFGERERRLFAGAQALSLGYGGITQIAEICGLSRVTITKGIKELNEEPLEPGRRHKKGAGRPSIEITDPSLEKCLLKLVEDTTRGDPEGPLRWTCKSTRTLALELSKKRHYVSHEKVAQILKKNGYSLQANQKTEEGADHVDRDAQFKNINKNINSPLSKGSPVISVDTKKKEILGNFHNKGQQWRKSKNPRKVNGHDFPDPNLPRAFPYGIYDLDKNMGFIIIGTTHDTGEFAVNSIKDWWIFQGQKLYKNVESLLITADGGGSNSYRSRLWKFCLQKLANYLQVPIKVCHFPPGTSKWNKIEHRLFSFISSNWRGEPLIDYETMVSLIRATTTSTGLKVACRLDRRNYNIGKKISDDQILKININPLKFHGEWNYVILPNN
jgi:transposase